MSEPPPHGTESRYLPPHRCRCNVCGLYRYRAVKRWQRERRVNPLIDAAPAYAHIGALAAEGFEPKAIWRLAGYIKQHKTPAKIHARKAAALLAVTRQMILDRAPGHSKVPAIGAQRRIQALAAIGWHQGALPGVSLSSVSTALRRDRITADLHRRIAAAYDQLAMTLGPGRPRPYPPPLAWDDDALDDPAGQPDPAWKPVPIERVRAARAERAEAVAAMTAAGLSAAQIADRLGVARRTVVRYRSAS